MFYTRVFLTNITENIFINSSIEFKPNELNCSHYTLSSFTTDIIIDIIIKYYLTSDNTFQYLQENYIV